MIGYLKKRKINASKEILVERLNLLSSLIHDVSLLSKVDFLHYGQKLTLNLEDDFKEHDDFMEAFDRVVELEIKRVKASINKLDVLLNS